MGQHVTQMTMRGLLARSGGVGAMGHLGHLAIVFKSPPYNIVTVHPYSICDILLFVVLYDPNDPKATLPL